MFLFWTFESREKIDNVCKSITTQVESRWNGVVVNLKKPVQFTVTLDIKRLIRAGIPINQRGVVWKAIVDNR